MKHDVYQNGTLLSRSDAATRTVTTYDENGEVTSTRPYTQEENDAADAAQAAHEQAEAQRQRAELADAILDATAALMEDAHEDGAPWVQPQGAHDAYPIGRTVTHNGKTWENITLANVWEPGVSGWREEAGSEPTQWIQPTGAHDAYAQGAVVTHNEFTWVSDVDDNVWEPGVYGWTKH